MFVHSTVTDSYGEFWFAQRRAFSQVNELAQWIGGESEESRKGLYTLLVASKEGYVTARRQVDLESATEPQKMVLREAPKVSGQVVWRRTGEPAAEIHVVCTPMKADLYHPSRVECVSDEGGVFSLTVAAEGTARIDAGSLYFYPLLGLGYATADITLVPEESIFGLILAIELRSGTLIEGRVLNADGAPVAGAEVRLSTDKCVGEPIRSRENGAYTLIVPKSWPYQSYFVDDWPDKPELVWYHKASVAPKAEVWGPAGKSQREWEWRTLWIPPPHSPPERLVAFHPDYEVGVVEVPLLGVGQVRQSVDIVLYDGSKISGRVVDAGSRSLSE